MSYDPRLARRPYGASGDDDDDGSARKGSVRAARERLQAGQIQGQLPDRSRIIGLPQRPNQLVSQYSVQDRPRQPQNLTPPDSRGNALSPQWPLSNDVEGALDSQSSPQISQFPRSPNRGPPPQRPPRPVSDDLPIQPTSPGYRESYQSDDMLSPGSITVSSRPLTTSSAASEASSLGSIPDFPIPQPPMPTIQPLPRRTPSLGPPPSARRGPSSYYNTQLSYVSPIAEESETRSDGIRSHHGSFASSNVFPTNANDFYLEDDDIRSDDEETVTSDYGRESRASDHDDRSGLVQQPALVRQASLGRRTKPSLMTIKSVDSFGEKNGGPAKLKAVPDEGGSGAGAAGIGGAILAARDGIAGQKSPGPPSGSLSSGTGLFDASSSSTESLTSLKNNAKSKWSDSDSQRALDPEKGGLESPVHPLQQSTRQTLAERVGKRRPPRIDVDAVREAEARGSLTSLPELIRRATRLAANLDRGKTASRLGLDFWEAGAPEKGKFDTRRSGSLSDMLAAFPPPGDATPAGDRSFTPNQNRMSKWPSGGVMGGTESALSDRKSNKRRRRCCGMPMWTFVTLLIVLIFLVAAAVIIPVVLIVIPKMRDSQSSAAQGNQGGGNNNNNNNNNPTAPVPTGGNDQCDGVITCQNGGVAIMNSDRSCNCVCINGFTGRTCATEGDAGCTTADIAGAANNATIGTGIPRLIETAQSNFSIPLDSTRILSLFSDLALSCTAENALITFNGLASRSLSRNSIPIVTETTLEASRSLPLLDVPHPEQQRHGLEERQTVGGPGVANSNSNSNGNSNSDATPTATAKASATPTPDQPISSNATAIDFARIGVLLALQETGKLDTAASAQESIQDFLTNDRNGNGNGNTVNVGPFEMDLVAFSIEFQNGTILRAGPSNTTT